MISEPELLVKYIRDGLVEQAHSGFVLVSDISITSFAL